MSWLLLVITGAGLFERSGLNDEECDEIPGSEK